MNTFSSDTALPSGQMGSLKHLGLDGAGVGDGRIRRHTRAFLREKKKKLPPTKNMANPERRECRRFKSHTREGESEPLMWKIEGGKKNAVAESR